jgi:hypothetical protein
VLALDVEQVAQVPPEHVEPLTVPPEQYCPALSVQRSAQKVSAVAEQGTRVCCSVHVGAVWRQEGHVLVCTPLAE